MSRFRYTQLSDKAKFHAADVIRAATDLEKTLERLPPSRELSLAFTKLEEAVMWARKALRDVQ